MANECSFIPKGTRIEDRYVESVDKNSFNAYVKIGLEFQICDSAKKTVQPEEIKNLASLPFSEQLRKYQELAETGEIPTGSELVEVVPPTEYASPPTHGSGYDDNVHFFVTRQYVAYQKQIVIFAPFSAFAPGSADNERFVTALSPSVQQIRMTETEHPTLLSQATTWSTLKGRPSLARPLSLTSSNRHQISSQPQRPQRMMRNPNRSPHPQKGGNGRGNPYGHGKKRKRKYQDQEN